MSSKPGSIRAVVLAGGKGTRLAPYTRLFPKPLMPIGDYPILEIMLRQMKRAGIRHVTLTVGYLGNMLRLFFQDGTRLGMQIEYVDENKPLGTSGPLANVAGLEDTFLVTNGDVLTDLDLNDLISFHQEQRAIATIATHKRKVNINLGVVDLDKQNAVVDYLEKPSIDYLVSMGVYVFEPRVLQYIPKDEYLDFPDLVKTLVPADEKVSGYVFKGYWEDLGNADDYARATSDFEKDRSRFLPE
jgi:NDP-sugar pyrophosphorylase family protein